jgi:hypothetical protein
MEEHFQKVRQLGETLLERKNQMEIPIKRKEERRKERGKNHTSVLKNR